MKITEFFFELKYSGYFECIFKATMASTIAFAVYLTLYSFGSILSGKKSPVMIIKGTAIAACVLVILSIITFSIAALFCEFPTGYSKIFYLDRQENKWTTNVGNEIVWHRFADFDGYNIRNDQLCGSVEMHDKSPFTMHYKVEPGDIIEVLSSIGPDRGTSFDYKLNDFIRARSYELFFKTSREDLLDDNLRLDSFKQFYGRFGITVTAVNYE